VPFSLILRAEGAEKNFSIGKNNCTFKMAWGKIFVPLEEYIPPAGMEINIGSTLLPPITVTVLLQGGPLHLHPHQLLQPAGQAVDGHAGSTPFCTLSKHHLPSSLFHSCNLCLGWHSPAPGFSALFTYSPACSSIILMVLLPLLFTSPLHPLSNLLPVSPALPGGTL
jgi:hypothetical protein